MSNHTPGPWVVIHAYQGYSVGVQEAKNTFPKSRLCDMVTGTPQDAALIAAAPDLLEALTAVLDAHAANILFNNAGHWEAARAALEKATS